MLPTTNPTPPDVSRQPFAARKFLCSMPLLYEHPICPAAQTLLAHDIDYNEDLVLVLPCKQWSCRWCAPRKIASLARRTALAQPNRLLTLTINPARHETPRDAFDATRRQIPVLVNLLRKRFGDLQYLRVTELTRLGWPHYHFLVRSPYLPHPVIKTLWDKLTGATIVDVRTVNKTFKAYSYLVKYLSKLHTLDWTERHCSYSRSFFPPEPPDDRPKRNLHGKTIVPQHPFTYLEVNHHGQEIAQTSPGTYRVFLSPPASQSDSPDFGSMFP